MTKKVLVTGATGNIGSQLVAHLAASDDIAVRAFVHHAEKAAPLKALGADLALGTFEDAQAMRAAVEGIDTIVLLTAMNPNAADQARAVLTAAKAAGVRKIVRISAVNAAVDGPTDNTRLHGRTDQEIQAAGLTYTILRPHYFMQNLFIAAQSIASEGKLYMGMGDGKLGMIACAILWTVPSTVYAQTDITTRFSHRPGQRASAFRISQRRSQTS